jgi:predicted hotdog family 3-hydroxylacyl-ACP dehydratase
VSRRYRGAGNPLRGKNGTLGIACGIELAAQAMALHGRLTAGTEGPPRGGMLASVRDVRFGAPYLDAGIGDLSIEAARLLGDSAGAAYSFRLTCDDVELLSGRATVLMGEQK